MSAMNRSLGYVASTLILAIAPALAHDVSPQGAPGIFIMGTVRDVEGAAIPDAVVTLDEKGQSALLEAKTGAEGTFSFLSLHAGTFTVRVKRIGFRGAFTEPMELSLGQNRKIAFVLKVLTTDSGDTPPPELQRSSGASTPQTIEFSDQPSFTVAGVTGWSNTGLHGSDVDARTSESLAKATLALKTGAAEKLAAVSTETAAKADAHRVLGDAAERKGDPLEAVREYEQAARLDPSEQNYFQWGAELLLHRAVNPAIEVFTNGSRKFPASARILAGLGAALYAARSYEEAALRLCEASDLKPEDPAPYLFLGKMQKTAPDPLPCAEEKLARFASGQPANAQANYYYGVSLWKRERAAANSADSHQSENLLEKAVALDPKFAEANLQLGILRAERGDFAAALRDYQKAMDADPQLGEAHYRMALAYKRTGDAAKAQHEFQAYEQIEKTEAAAAERQRRELRQFVIVLRDQTAASPPNKQEAPSPPR
jgi:tetratricopeptide (TPR) repeat protein